MAMLSFPVRMFRVRVGSAFQRCFHKLSGNNSIDLKMASFRYYSRSSLPNPNVTAPDGETTIPCTSRVQKITILGAGGRTGMPVALLLKQSALFDEIALYDELPFADMGEDLNWIDTRSVVSTHDGKHGLCPSLKDARVVVMMASAPFLPVMSDQELFKKNAPIICELTKACISICPKAFVCVVTSPLNALTAMVSAMYREAGVHDPRKIFGVTAIDYMRANQMAAKCAGKAPEEVGVPVVGGHSEDTIIPVLSASKPPLGLEQEVMESLTESIRSACRDVEQMKSSANPASLAPAFAVARFLMSLGGAISGQLGVVECALVNSDSVWGTTYFATPLMLGQCGVQTNFGLPTMNAYESKLLRSAVKCLNEDIKMGEQYVCYDPCAVPPPKFSFDSEQCAERRRSCEDYPKPGYI